MYRALLPGSYPLRFIIVKFKNIVSKKQLLKFFLLSCIIFFWLQNVNAATVNITTTSGGLAASPLNVNQNGIAVLGFSTTSTSGSLSVTQFIFTGSSAINPYFSNYKLYSSVNNTYSGTDPIVTGATYTISGATLTFSFPPQSITTIKYYFLIADYAVASSTSSTYQFSLTGLTGAVATSGNLPKSGPNYTVSAYSCDWIGSATNTTAANNWATAANWSGSHVPSTYDIVNIAVNQLPNYNPVINSGSTINVGAVVFGGQFTTGTGGLPSYVYPGITVNGTLNVGGDITTPPDAFPGSIGTAIPINQYLLSGSGMVTANNISISALYGANASTESCIQAIYSSVGILNILGNVGLLSENYKNGATIYNHAADFFQTAGTVTIGGIIQTTNSTNTTTYPTSTFQINPVSTATLNLSNANALSLGGTGTNVIDFNNAGTTVNYNGTNQTVYTSTASNVSGGISYYNLTLSGGTETPASATLAIANDFTTTGGGTVNLSTNNPTITVGHDWVNSSNVTGGSNPITVSDILQNNANTITFAAGATNITNGIQINSGSIIAGSGTVTDNGYLQNNSGTLQCGSGSFIIKANYTNSGIFTAGTGSVFFSGSAAQLLSDISAAGTQFNKVSFTGTVLANAKTMSGSGGFAVSPAGILTMVGALTTLDAGGVLTLRSTSAGSAAVDIIPAGSVIKGTVNAERFLTGGGTFQNRGYRLLSSPVNQTQYTAGTVAVPNTFGLNYLNQHTYGSKTYPGVFTAGPGISPGNGFSGSNKNPLIYLYDERRTINNSTYISGKHIGVNSIATVSSISTVTLSDGTTNVPIPVGNGFLMFFVGPSTRTDSKSTTAPLDATMTANGYINQGIIPVDLYYTTPVVPKGNLSYTTAFGTANAGYNMAGNPYPSTIDLNQVIADNQTITIVAGVSIVSGVDVAYILSGRTLASQAYIACTTSGTSAPNLNYAASGEGFIVHATGTGKTLIFKESEKVPTVAQLPVPGMILSAPTVPTPNKGIGSPGNQNSFAAVEHQDNVLTGFYLKMEKDSDTYNYCGIYFRKDWSDKYEAGDALDMNGGLPVQMSSLTSDGLIASVNHLPDYTKGINVKLFAAANADGQYKLKIEDVRNIDTLYDIFLIDHYKKDSLDLRRYGVYLFDVTKADTSSFGTERFELSVRPRPLPTYRLLNFTAQKITGGVQVSWKTVAESNYTGFVLQKQDGTTFNVLYSKRGDGSGIYTFIDPKPVTGANTYRLQQDNIVGAISVSPAITIVYDPAGGTGLMSVYPNPAKATINVSVSSTTSAAPTYKANIYNSAGQLMTQRSVSSNSWTQDVTQYMPGTYIIQLNDNSGNLIGKSKFVKTN